MVHVYKGDIDQKLLRIQIPSDLNAAEILEQVYPFQISLKFYNHASKIERHF
jgi:hypothetical protein